jgi:hypothetical protein
VLRAAYESSTLDDLANDLDVSRSTVRRALIRHGIDRLPRNRNRLPPKAQVLNDPVWLAEQYEARTAVAIAHELGVTSTAVYLGRPRSCVCQVRPRPHAPGVKIAAKVASNTTEAPPLRL